MRESVVPSSSAAPGKPKTYIFQVVLEPDDGVWSACCPTLLKQGASTWGNSRREALANIAQVVKMVVESLIEHGEPAPEEPMDATQPATKPQVVVAV